MLQANGIRECFVNVSQLSQASSCDYSMSQFRADESAFVIRGDVKEEADDSRGSNEYAGNGTVVNNGNESDDDDDVPIAARKKIKRELSDDEDEAPVS